MKKFGIITLAVAIVGASLAFTLGGNDGSTILEIGKSAPMASSAMKDVSGKMISLEDAKQENGLIVIFSCNSCPFVVGATGYGSGWEGRYNEINDFATKNKIGTVLVNSNEGKRTGADSFAAMQERAKEQKYKSFYVLDENSAMANAFGAKTTPHVFMFNNKMELVYKGAIDDNNEDAGKVKESWLKDAITALAAGNEITPNSTRQKGCSIKRVK